MHAVPPQPPAVVLVAMPFALVNIPSIQIGTLTSVLAQHAIAARPLSLHLAFAEHLLGAGLDLGDYQRLAYGPEAIVEWIFAAPPFRPAAPGDETYPDNLRAAYPESADLVGIAERVRAAVPAFLERWTDEIAALAPTIVGFTTTFVQTIPALALAWRIKQRLPDVRIVLGGGNCDGPMGEALGLPPFAPPIARARSPGFDFT
jgi:hypothetical protein